MAVKAAFFCSSFNPPSEMDAFRASRADSLHDIRIAVYLSRELVSRDGLGSSMFLYDLTIQEKH